MFQSHRLPQYISERTSSSNDQATVVYTNAAANDVVAHASSRYHRLPACLACACLSVMKLTRLIDDICSVMHARQLTLEGWRNVAFMAWCNCMRWASVGGPGE
jgi:hypothetical protein